MGQSPVAIATGVAPVCLYSRFLQCAKIELQQISKQERLCKNIAVLVPEFELCLQCSYVYECVNSKLNALLVYRELVRRIYAADCYNDSEFK